MGTEENRSLQLDLDSQVNAATLGPKPVEFELAATEGQLDGAAEELGVDAVLSLKAAGRMSRRKDIARMTVQIECLVRQICVVTLEPVESLIETEAKLTFGEPRREEGSEIEIDPFSDDPPEELDSGAIPLRKVTIEQILLEIDPYPRKQGLEFVEIVEDDAKDDPVESKPESPFAALAALKDRLN
jgi:uncharacterized metal-binding protein YceD (DUF177 family)